MNLTILDDARRRPDLFVWQGPVDPGWLDGWLRARRLKIPAELRFVWIETGGGDFLENETILGPTGDITLADDVHSVNAYHRTRGLSEEYLVFNRRADGVDRGAHGDGHLRSVERVALRRDGRLPV